MVYLVLRDLPKCGVDRSARDVVAILSGTERVVWILKLFPKEVVKHPQLTLAWNALSKRLNEEHDLEKEVISHPAKSTDLLRVPVPEENQCSVKGAGKFHSL